MLVAVVDVVDAEAEVEIAVAVEGTSTELEDEFEFEAAIEAEVRDVTAAAQPVARELDDDAQPQG